MKPMLFPAVLAAAVTTAGCAASRPAARASGQPYVLESLEFHGLPSTQLAVAREKSRADSQQRVLMRNDIRELTAQFAANLRHDLQIAEQAPLRLRIDVRLSTPGQFEGLAAENTDVAADVTVVDAGGSVVRSFVVRETANAPLQRSASRRERFEAALARLSQKLAQRL